MRKISLRVDSSFCRDVHICCDCQDPSSLQDTSSMHICL